MTIPKEKMTAWQRWELADFSDKPKPAVAKAAAEFEQLAAGKKDVTVSRGALWQAAELYEKAKTEKEIVFYSGGPAAPHENRAKLFMQQYPGIEVKVTGGFSNVLIAGLTGVSASSAAWGDYDNDGRLDFLIMGHNVNTRYSQLWRNSTPVCAPRPTPTMIDIGVARPRAQGDRKSVV